MYLSSTSDILRIVTGAAVTAIGVQASWIDADAGYTPGRTNTRITTATTTTIVDSPGSGTVRSVKSLHITNDDAAASCAVTIQHFDGTTSVDIEKITLMPGEEFFFDETGEWRHLSAAGAEYEYSNPGFGNLGPTGTLAESLPRHLITEADATSALSSGNMSFAPIFLRAGTVVTNISAFSGTAAAGTPTHYLFGLYDMAGQLLATTADQGSAAWAATTLKTIALQSAYTIQQTGYYYIAIMVAATTVPTLKGYSRSTKLHGQQPLLFVRPANAGLTTALADSIDLLTGSPVAVLPFWAAIS